MTDFPSHVRPRLVDETIRPGDMVKVIGPGWMKGRTCTVDSVDDRSCGVVYDGERYGLAWDRVKKVPR